MMIQLHDFFHRLSPALIHILEKLAILSIPIPLFMLFTGTLGIIENDSPENLANLNTLGSSFFNFFEMHSMIILGALGVTFIVWLLTRHIWLRDDATDEEISESETEQQVDVAQTDATQRNTAETMATSTTSKMSTSNEPL